jgi:hypothetical protein
MGELDVTTPFVSMNRNPKYYSSGDGLITFTYTNDVDQSGKALSSSSTLYVALQNQEGEQAGTEQPASAPASKSEGSEKPKP